MNVIDFTSSFPASIPCPPELRALCEWEDRNGYPISGFFELEPHDDETIRCWFGSDAAIGRLAIFGHGPDGTLYAVWNQDDGRRPIVHIGSEGTDTFVLASNALDFLRLLAIGYDEIGFADLSAPPDSEDVNPAFQEWVATTFRVAIPPTGVEIVQPAQASHDDLGKWIELRIG